MEIEHKIVKSLRNSADRLELAKHLPEVPRDDMAEFVKAVVFDKELGGDFCVFKRTSIDVCDEELGRTMTPEDQDRFETGIHRRWVAECQCSACGEKFITGWNSEHSSDKYSVLMYAGDDGANYPGHINPEEVSANNAYCYSEGDTFGCPFCEHNVELIHNSRLRHGRTYQCMLTSVEVVDNYAMLVTWLARRHIDADFIFENVKILPCEALVIDGKHLYQYSHVKFNGLHPEKHLQAWVFKSYYGKDLSLRRYYDWASIEYRKTDSYTYQGIQDLTGTTGEKTGIAEYIRRSTCQIVPFAYLKLWRKHPNAENLVKSAWRTVLDSALQRVARGENYAYNANYSIEMPEFCFDESAPHKILGITKAESRINYGWKWSDFQVYQHHLFFHDVLTVAEFDELLTRFSSATLMTLDILAADYNLKYLKMLSYLEKQDVGDIHLYIDYIEMLGDGEHTDREKYPKNLRVAHDTLAERIKAEKQSKYEAAFAELAEKYAPLEWSDGELCIRIARSEKELIKEGKVLHHCVGGYGHKHASESDVIFFVRHYRRPERSYYTLDINMTKAQPEEVQLHGYRNELYPSKHFRRSAIPQKVRDFCDRWESEILIPTIAKMKKKQSKSIKHRREKVA